MDFIKKYKKIIVILLIIIGIIFFCYLNNNIIVVTDIEYKNSKIPVSFNGYRIVQISDLHNKEFGKNQKELLNKIRNLNPDIIVITGDIVDMKKYDLDIALYFVKGAVDISDVYYVSGNHEASLDYKKIKNELIDEGVIVLDNDIITIKNSDDEIDIIGVSDPNFGGVINLENTIKGYKKDNRFQILLSHRPELFDLYCDLNMDLVMSGHAHGGQFRLPFVGGVVAPNQGIFPSYTSGIHTKENTSMIVSRGLGNSIIPVRVFNLPEIVLVTLNSN